MKTLSIIPNDMNNVKNFNFFSNISISKSFVLFILHYLKVDKAK